MSAKRLPLVLRALETARSTCVDIGSANLSLEKERWRSGERRAALQSEGHAGLFALSSEKE